MIFIRIRVFAENLEFLIPFNPFLIRTGKSTLLECLAGRRTLNLTGSITINYSPDYLERGERVKVSFIAQRDNVIGVLTVKEILMFASRLKNYGKIKNSYYHPRLVKSILKELGLDKCANIPSNKISGGQLKRLSFATELISGPDILLLDEVSLSCYY